jgi:hypothetical protein
MAGGAFFDYLIRGLVPPVPNELRADFALASPEEQARRRMVYAVRLLRWSRVVGTVGVLMILKGLWQAGVFTALGLPGVASAGDVQRAMERIQAQQQEQAEFRAEYRRDKLEARLKAIQTERVQITIAIQEAERQGQRPLTLLSDRLGALASEEGEVLRQLDPPMGSRPR